MEPTQRPSDDELREQLAQMAYEFVRDRGDNLVPTFGEFANQLLPVVRRAQAAALRQAADELHLNISGREGLRDRADGLDPQ